MKRNLSHTGRKFVCLSSWSDSRSSPQGLFRFLHLAFLLMIRRLFLGEGLLWWISDGRGVSPLLKRQSVLCSECCLFPPSTVLMERRVDNSSCGIGRVIDIRNIPSDVAPGIGSPTFQRQSGRQRSRLIANR